MIIITDDERLRFKKYLEQEITSNNTIVEQMKKINTPYKIIELYEAKSRAAKIVITSYLDKGQS